MAINQEEAISRVQGLVTDPDTTVISILPQPRVDYIDVGEAGFIRRIPGTWGLSVVVEIEFDTPDAARRAFPGVVSRIESQPER
jgi:hypothetical protein